MAKLTCEQKLTVAKALSAFFMRSFEQVSDDRTHLIGFSQPDKPSIKMPLCGLLGMQIANQPMCSDVLLRVTFETTKDSKTTNARLGFWVIFELFTFFVVNRTVARRY